MKATAGDGDTAAACRQAGRGVLDTGRPGHFTALIAWLVLGESLAMALAMAALPGMLLAVAGIYLVMRKS